LKSIERPKGRWDLSAFYQPFTSLLPAFYQPLAGWLVGWLAGWLAGGSRHNFKETHTFVSSALASPQSFLIRYIFF